MLDNRSGSTIPTFIRWALAGVLVLSGSAGATAGSPHTAVIPSFYDREHEFGIEGPIRVSSLAFTLFVYRDAVAVYEEADMMNMGKEPVSRDLSLPSTGFDQNGAEPGGAVSSGLLGVQLWVDGERTVPRMLTDGDGVSWYTIRASFQRFETKRVKALFWVRTFSPGTDQPPGLDTTTVPGGQRRFMVDLSHAAMWAGDIETLDVTALLRDGMDVTNAAFSATPDSYENYDAVVTWHLQDVEPSRSEDISVQYIPDDGQRRALSLSDLAKKIAHEGYDELLRTVDSMREP